MLAARLSREPLPGADLWPGHAELGVVGGDPGQPRRVCLGLGAGGWAQGDDSLAF